MWFTRRNVSLFDHFIYQAPGGFQLLLLMNLVLLDWVLNTKSPSQFGIEKVSFINLRLLHSGNLNLLI